MSKTEWFRRTTWSPAEEAEFLARLKRSRTELHRAQYLRIQAWHLADTGDPALLDPAVRLLDLLITEYPHPSQLSLAHHQRAKCLVDMGEVAEALNAFRSALEARRIHRGVESDAQLDFGEVVCALKRTELFAEVAAALDEFGSGSPFPAHVYKYHAIRAVLAEAAGDLASAREHAQAALKAANATESPFRRHRSLGLVTHVDPHLIAQLRALAA